MTNSELNWNSIYEFLTGPALWFTFIFFIGGLLLRMAFLFRLSRKKDRVIYNHVNLDWGLRSILHWIIPFASVSMRQQPIFSLVAFIFHLTLIAVPLFLSAHIVLWEEAFGITLWSISDGLSDALTLVFIAAALFLTVRRRIRPEVRILTGAWDYALLAITMLPFITGFLAYHQWGPYEAMLILHIVSGQILLILIPITKLAHMILFFFTRAFIGFEMGGRRGARTW
ncbi:MAG: nitrate reductase [Deltaproteobacteria bacterium]|jgi:nitrate reductase gamma subunit|nr:nitrate reductase [Deltaproteobacteria bacterium]